MKGGQDERKERKDGVMKSGGQRGGRRGACRDQGRRSKAQPGGSNEREGLNQDGKEKINTEKRVKIYIHGDWK